MIFKKAIIAYLPRKTHGKYREKNNILCYNETFKGCADNAKQNRQSKQKRGLLSMENKNTQANNTSSSLERNELHNTIWKVANELRGSVDG